MILARHPGRVPVYQRIADRLRDEIAHPPSSRNRYLPTENELASRFSVSRMTLRAALKCLATERLIRPHRPLGWEIIQPGGTTRLERLIGMVYGSDGKADFPMLREAGLSCQRRNISFKPVFIDRWPDKLEELVQPRAGDGFLYLSGPSVPERLLKDVSRLGLPAAAVGFVTNQMDSIHPDWANATAMMVRHLAERGCRDLFYVGWRGGGESSFVEFPKGFMTETVKQGVRGRTLLTELNWISPREETRLARLLESSKNTPSALIVGSQVVYSQVLPLIIRLGLRIPTDLSLALLGADPHPTLLKSMGVRSLAHVDFDWAAAVRWAVERISLRAQHPLLPVMRGHFNLSLIEGSSVRRILREGSARPKQTREMIVNERETP